MCVRMRVRVCMRVHMIVINSHPDTTRDTGPRKREDHGKSLYIGIFADNEKKYKKIKEKFGNMKKPPYLCSRNQKTKQYESLLLHFGERGQTPRNRRNSQAI